MKVCKRCKVKFRSGSCPKCRSTSNVVDTTFVSSYDLSTFSLLDSVSSSYNDNSSSSNYGSSSSSDSGSYNSGSY